MKILLVNYRYFISGGPERYFFNIKEIFEKEGNDVITFSIKNSNNIPSEYSKYFLDGIDDDIYFSQSKKNLLKIIKSFFRMFYSFEAKSKFKKLIIDTKPDIIYIMQYHNKISPSIIDIANKFRIPVVHRISDFQYMCPNALFYNNRIGICENCLQGNKFRCIKYKCVLNSYIYSAIKLMVKKLHELLNVTNKIDSFVVPSTFTLHKLQEYGIPMNKLNHIPTFFNLREEPKSIVYNKYFLYIGRIEKQKGLFTMIKAFEDTDYNLKIIGFSNEGYEEKLKKYLIGKSHNIEFLGKKSFDEIIPYLKTCLCTIVPSEWYDNFPNVILESFAYKKSVIATDIGSLPELVINDKTGLLFKYADSEDLKSKIKYIYNNNETATSMGNNAYNDLLYKYSPEVHYKKIIDLFNKILYK